MSKSPIKKLNLNDVLGDVDKKPFFQQSNNTEEQGKGSFFSTPNRAFGSNETPVAKPGGMEESGMEIEADEIKKNENQPQVFGNPQPTFFSPPSNQQQQQQQSFMNLGGSNFVGGGSSIFNPTSYNPHDARTFFQQSPLQESLFSDSRNTVSQGSNANKRKKDRSVRVYQ